MAGVEMIQLPKGTQSELYENSNLSGNVINCTSKSSEEFTASQGDIKVGILGYGDYGKSLATRLRAVGMTYSVGSRNPSRWDGEKGDGEQGPEAMSYSEMIAKSDVIILAIKSQHYDDVIPELRHDLAKKTVVDISNAVKLTDQCNAVYLQQLLPSSNVVKAFNTVSAWAMSNDIYGASRHVYVCGDDERSRTTVMQLAQELGFMAVERGRLRGADVLEKTPLRLFPAWRNAGWITLGLLLLETAYYCLDSFTSEEPAKVVRHLALYHANRLFCWMALWLLALVYLPGCIAGFLQLFRGTKYSMFPNWLDQWMKSRKQLGLIALGFAGMHACLSCLALGSGYVKYMSKVVKIPGSNQVVYHQLYWNAEVSLLAATIAMTLLVVLGITSLPSVNQTMSWREWDFVQSKLGHLALFFAFFHVIIYAYSVFDPATSHHWKYGIPHTVFFMPLFPGIILVLKLVLMMPGIRGRLQRIRDGWEKNKPAKMGISV